MCNKYRLVNIEVVSNEYKQQTKCFLQGEKGTEGNLVLTARQLMKKIKSGEIDVVNMELTEDGELHHKFGLLKINSAVNISSLVEDVYVVGVDYNQIGSTFLHNETYRLIGRSGIIKGFERLNQEDLVKIIQSGKKLVNVELRAYTEESSDERRGKRVIRYEEEVVIKSIEDRVNEVKEKNPDILYNGEINPITSTLELESFWRTLDSVASISSEFLNDQHLIQVYEKIINSKVRYFAFVNLSDTELVAWHSILNKTSDAAYQHDMVIMSEKNFFKLFPYSKEKFKNCIHNLAWMYGEKFMKEFLVHPMETTEKYNVAIGMISDIEIWV